MKKDKNIKRKKSVKEEEIEKVPAHVDLDILKNWSYKQLEAEFPVSMKTLSKSFSEDYVASVIMNMKKVIGKRKILRNLQDFETHNENITSADILSLFLEDVFDEFINIKNKIKVLKKKIGDYESMSLCMYNGSCKYRSYNADKVSQMLCCVKDVMKTHNILMEKYDKKGTYTMVDDLVELMLDDTNLSKEAKQSVRRQDKYPMSVPTKNARRDILLRKIIPVILLSVLEASMNHYGNYKMINSIMEEYISIVISGTPYALIEDAPKAIVNTIVRTAPKYEENKEFLNLLNQ